MPVETRPVTAVAIAAVVLALAVWGWRRSSSVDPWAPGTVVLAVVLVTTSSGWGWDPSRAAGELALLTAAMALAWLASRNRPPGWAPILLASALAGLAVWGLWQSLFGLDAMQAGLDGLSATAREYAEQRLESRRAFASLPLPSHLAVLLATALPLLLSRLRPSPSGAVRLTGAILCLAGLVATRSPVGLGLGVAAAGAVLLGRGRRVAVAASVFLAGALLVVVVLRPDVGRLEPVALRLDNWRTAVWLWSTAPATGTGLASFAQASQAAPLEVGNRPAHAHSLPLEALAELGPAGLAACLVLAWYLLRLLRRLWPKRPELAAAVAVVPLHNLVDFSFFVSGVLVPWAVLLGWAVAEGRGDQNGEPLREARGRVVLVAAAALAVALTILHATSVVVEVSAASGPEAEHRFHGAVRALALAPWRVEPQFLLAAAALAREDRERLDRARSELERHRWWRPRSAALAERRARLALARGDVSTAAAELWTALRYGSPGGDAEHLLGELRRTLAGADDAPTP